MENETIDRQALTLSRAIALKESNGNANIVGDNGTAAGLGQWSNQINGKATALKPGEIPANFRSYAQKYGTSPDDFSPVNQEKTLYKEVAYKKNVLGWSPAQIAASHNAGDGRAADGSWQTNVGTTTLNGKQIHYDTPQYVNEVKANYDRLSGTQSTAQPQTSNGLPQAPTAPKPLLSAQDDLASSAPQTAPDNLGSDLSKRVQQGTEAASTGLSALAHGNLHGAASGLLQTVGAGAGAIGDVVNRGLELIPGVKQVEGFIGKGAAAVANTAPGQAVVKGAQSFAEKHPELSKDIGAGFNILTAIPILRGVGAIKNVAVDAASQGLKSAAEKSATEGFTNVVNSTKTGAKAFSRNPDAIKTLIDERAIPDIEDGKYTTREASAKLDDAINEIDKNELEPELAKASTGAIAARVPFGEVLKLAEQEATEAQEAFNPIRNELRLIQKKYGDYPTLKQLNDAKRIVSRKISQAAYGSPDSSAMKVARSVLQQTVEESAAKLGLKDVGAINAKMRRLIQAQDMLKYIDKKGVKTGMLGGALKDVATGAGEMAGNATGIPLAGAFVGRELGGSVGKKIAGARLGVLNRTGKDATRTSAKMARKRVTRGILGTKAQQITKYP